MTDKEDTSQLFDPNELSSLSDAETQAKLKIIHQRFAQRRAFYQQLRQYVFDLSVHSRVVDEVANFEVFYTPWNKETGQLVNSNNAKECVKQFKKGNEIFQPMEALVDEIQPLTFPTAPQIDALYRKLTSEFETKTSELKQDLLEKINSGIEDVLNIKRELELTDTFGTRIKTALEDAPKKARVRLLWFGGTLVLLIAILVGTFFVPQFTQLPWYASLALRVSIAAPLVWFAYVMYGDYRVQRVAELKYDHLDRLLGGGASTIAQLVQEDDPSKAATYRRLSELFLEIQDLTQLFSSHKHPTEASLKELNEMLKEMRLAFDQLRKVTMESERGA